MTKLRGNVGPNEIPLTRGEVAVVDPDWWEPLVQFNWSCHIDRYGRRSAVRTLRLPDEDGKKTVKKLVVMHRVICGATDGQMCDHRNGDSLDNRRANLRIVTTSENAHNSKKDRRNTTGFKGVKRQGGKWIARIGLNWKRIHLGTFDSPELAAHAYDKAAVKYHGEFARTNKQMGLLDG